MDTGSRRNAYSRKFAALTRKIGRFPTKWEIKLERTTNPLFPSSTPIGRLGDRTSLKNKLVEFCRIRNEYSDLREILEQIAITDVADLEVPEPSSGGLAKDGYVYLVDAQTAYKIGCTRAPYRRVAEIANQSADGATLEHLIPTDDPEGIEKYWYKRFCEKRIEGVNKQSGEWFMLSKDDVKAFKRRKGFM